MFSLSMQGQYGGYIFSQFSDKDGLPHSTVMDVMEDNDGYIWINTWNGICFFDGINFHKVELTEEGGASKINQSFHDLSDGKIWISNKRGILWEFDKFQNRYLMDSIVMPPKSKTLGHCNGKTVFHLPGEDEYFYINSSGTVQDIFFEVFANDQVRKHAQVMEIDGNTVICKEGDHYFTGRINSFRNDTIKIELCDFKIDQGKLHFSDNVMHVQNQLLSTECGQDTIVDLNAFEELRNENVSRFIVNQNDIWIYTKSSHFFIYNLESKNLVKIPPRVWNYELLSMNKDRSGNVWLGTANGLVRAEKSSVWKFYQSNLDTTIDERILMLVKDENGRVWTGGTDGKIFSYNPALKMDKILNLPYTLNSFVDRYFGRVFGMHLDASKHLWVSLKGDYSLHKININNFSSEAQNIYPAKQFGSRQRILRTIDISNDNTIWIGGYQVLNSYVPETDSLYPMLEDTLAATIYGWVHLA